MTEPPPAAPAAERKQSPLTVLVALSANALIAILKTGAAVLTGSASMVAEAAHSWADTGNEVFLLIAQKRSRRPADARHPGGYGRDAYVWSMFAAFGLFSVGAAVSVFHGLEELDNPEPAQFFGVAYAVLALSFLLEGTSFLQSVRQGRKEAAAADRELLEHILATSDPTLRAVFAEDAAALVGIVIATTGIALHQITGSSTYDAIGSILVGLLLGVTAVLLIQRNRRFLIGEAVDPRIRRAALERLLASPEIRSVSYLFLEYAGPQRISMVGRVDLEDDAPESQVAARLAALEATIAGRPGVSAVILALSHPGDPPLKI